MNLKQKRLKNRIKATVLLLVVILSVSIFLVSCSQTDTLSRRYIRRIYRNKNYRISYSFKSTNSISSGIVTTYVDKNHIEYKKYSEDESIEHKWFILLKDSNTVRERSFEDGIYKSKNISLNELYTYVRILNEDNFKNLFNQNHYNININENTTIILNKQNLRDSGFFKSSFGELISQKLFMQKDSLEIKLLYTKSVHNQPVDTEVKMIINYFGKVKVTLPN